MRMLRPRLLKKHSNTWRCNTTRTYTKVRMREILLAYQTLIDPESRRTYDMSRSEHMPGSSVPTEKNTEVSPTARREPPALLCVPHPQRGCASTNRSGRDHLSAFPRGGTQAESAGQVARRECSIHSRDILLPSLPASVASRLTPGVLPKLSGARLARVPAATLPALPCCLRKRANS
jgi:hypothetical protein